MCPDPQLMTFFSSMGTGVRPTGGAYQKSKNEALWGGVNAVAAIRRAAWPSFRYTPKMSRFCSLIAVRDASESARE